MDRKKVERQEIIEDGKKDQKQESTEYPIIIISPRPAIGCIRPYRVPQAWDIRGTNLSKVHRLYS